MAEKKVTKREMFAEIAVVVGAAGRKDLTDFIIHEVELLDKKTSASKESKGKIINEEIKTTILTVLESQGQPMTISDLMEDFRLDSYIEGEGDKAVIKVMTNQKMSSLVSQLVKAEKVVRTEDKKKKKAYFSLPQKNSNEETPISESEAVE